MDQAVSSVKPMQPIAKYVYRKHKPRLMHCEGDIDKKITKHQTMQNLRF